MPKPDPSTPCSTQILVVIALALATWLAARDVRSEIANVDAPTLDGYLLQVGHDLGTAE